MRKTKDVYYISGNTGILARDMGKALLCQFPAVKFNENSLSFIRNESLAQKAIKKILANASDTKPLVISTLFSQKLNDIFNSPQVDFINICDHHLLELENILEMKARRESGFARNDDSRMTKRVNAIHYTIAHDDGIATHDYDKAELIIVGVSRSGKTPISVYLATQMGIKTANYPLVSEDLTSFSLPSEIVRNKERVVGLTISPEVLSAFREKRYPGSSYAKISTCTTELEQSDQIFLQYKFPVVFSDGRSIEETATQVAQAIRKGEQ